MYEREPAARAVLDLCEAVFREERGGSLLEVMFGDSSSDSSLQLGLTQWTQPALYALEAALTELWSGVGVRPDVVLGHSVGEIAAAWTAGVFGLEEGMRFAARRGALMGSLPAGGGMTAVFAREERVLSALAAVNGEAEGPALDLAADNGSHRVVSGPLELLAALEERLAREGVRTERLSTSHAFHSALMDPVLEEVGSAAEGLSGTPSLPLVSNLTGRVVGSEEVLDGGYWRRQARSAVRFGAGVRTLHELGVGVLVEVGPTGGAGSAGGARLAGGGVGQGVGSGGGIEPGPGDGVRLRECRVRMRRGFRFRSGVSTRGSAGVGCRFRRIRSSGSGTGWSPAVVGGREAHRTGCWGSGWRSAKRGGDRTKRNFQ